MASHKGLAQGLCTHIDCSTRKIICAYFVSRQKIPAFCVSEEFTQEPELVGDKNIQNPTIPNYTKVYHPHYTASLANFFEFLPFPS